MTAPQRRKDQLSQILLMDQKGEDQEMNTGLSIKVTGDLHKSTSVGAVRQKPGRRV